MSFKESLRQGSIGEQVAWDLLRNQKSVRNIVDMRKDKKFQNWDIDFLIERYDGSYTWCDVKTDYYAQTSGNLPFEVYSSMTYKTEGCFTKTQADIWLFYLPEADIMYCVSIPRVRKFIEFNKERIQLRKMGDDAYGYLLPIEALRQNKIIGEMKNEF